MEQLIRDEYVCFECGRILRYYNTHQVTIKSEENPKPLWCENVCDNCYSELKVKINKESVWVKNVLIIGSHGTE